MRYVLVSIICKMNVFKRKITKTKLVNSVFTKHLTQKFENVPHANLRANSICCWVVDAGKLGLESAARVFYLFVDV